MNILTYLTEGSRLFSSKFKNQYFPTHYQGSAAEICHQIVQDCWNGTYFQTSTQNFPQFWTRDFGWCVQSLLKLRYEKEVQLTLRYALNRFKKAKVITTTITPRGRPFDFPNYAVDSLPWFIHSLKIAKFPYYDHKHFLNQQIQHFYSKVIDPQNGLVRPNLHFSSIKDYSLRKSSCYDNCMVALLAKDLQSMKLWNPFGHFQYPELIKRHFWNESFFYDDLTKQDYVAGDANLFPFILGIITEKEMMLSALQAIQQAQLDQPFPLKYTADRQKASFIWAEKLVPNYEGTAIWSHIGLLFLKFVQHLDPEQAKMYYTQYKEQIEQHKNFLEVFDDKGKPFKTWFYHASPGMLWAANYLTL